MLKKRQILLIVSLLIVLLPVWMLLGWVLTPKKKLVVAIVDKTVLTREGQEHISLSWVLKHEKYTKNKSDLYAVSDDYFGFFPKDHEKYRIKGLERFTTAQLEQLSRDADLVYVTDAYGIYTNEWYKKRDLNERSQMIYGGMSQQDVNLMAAMKAKHKLIITEFNSIASPTPTNIRNQFEQLFNMHWTGWVGRYFESLDTTGNEDVPKWLINAYVNTAHQPWKFKKAGVVFVSDNDGVVILESGKDVSEKLPRIVSSEEGMAAYGLPKEFYYPFWFDVIAPNTDVNKVLSHFEFGLTASGKQQLAAFHIPEVFPAVQMHKGSDYQFFYFSADFSDNPLSGNAAYFKWIEHFSFLLYNKADEADRRKFFWKFYRPMLTTILDDYYHSKPH